MKKQSSIEFLIEMTKPINWKLETWKEHYKEVFQKAKEMHKQEIIEAREDGFNSTYAEYGENPRCYLVGSSEYYYKDTYEKES